jgi:multisubunit Na+/H+ antiporter MnhG subunit
VGAAVNLRNLNDLTFVMLAAVVHLLASPPASSMVSRATYLTEVLPEGAIDEHAELSGGGR